MTVTVTVPTTMSSDGTVHIYTDDSNPTTGLDGGGHVTRLLPLILDNVYITNYAVTQANAAAASAVIAANVATGISATSTTSTTIGTGSKTFTTQSGKQFQAGQTLKIVSQANSLNFMIGDVSSYTTTSLIVNVTSTGGSGTFADWNISISGVKGDTGATGAVNSGAATNITGLFKGNGSTITVATVRTDYAEPTISLATGLLKNTATTGAHTIAVAETDYVTPNGAGTLSGKTITGLKETKTAPTISAGVVTLDCNTSNLFAISLNANITSFTVNNIPATGTLYVMAIELTADGTARTVTWSLGGVSVKWAGGTAPTLTSTNGKKDTFILYTWSNGTEWLGFKAGQNL